MFWNCFPLLVIISLFLIPFSYASIPSDFNENKQPQSSHENFSSSKRNGLFKERSHSKVPSFVSKGLSTVMDIKASLQESYHQASKDSLFKNYNKFYDLAYEESVWQQIAQTLEAKKWPLQKSWKDVVGGHLFFPKTLIFNFNSTKYTEHLLMRSDILWGCGFAGTFHHPLGLFYLGHTLIKLNWLDQWDDDNSGPKESIKFCYKILERAYEDLNHCLKDDIDVFYSVVWGHLTEQYAHTKHNTIESLANYSFTDLRSQFILFSLKEKFKGIFLDQPTVNDFLFLAQRGYKPAYLKAAYLAREFKDSIQEVAILTEAIKDDYLFAYLGMASIYRDTHTQNYLVWLEKGIQANMAQAFILKGISIVGDINWKVDKEKLAMLTPEMCLYVINLFKKAGSLHDPESYAYLGRLKQELSFLANSSEEKASLKKESCEAYLEGCKLGSSQAYSFLYDLSEYDYDYVCQSIASDPLSLWEDFEHLLKEKGNLEFSLL